MIDTDQVFGEFVEAWNAGRRPRLDQYLARVPPGPQRDELAGTIETFLDHAATPDFSADQRAAIRAEPALQAVFAATDMGTSLLPPFLRRLRERRSLSVDGLADEVVERTATIEAPDAQARAAEYLRQLEDGVLDPGRLSTRLVDALAEALESTSALLRTSGAAAAPPASVLFRGEGDADVGVHLATLAEAAFTPAVADEVDQLFLGGPEG